ncbi:MAG: DUF4268 domain-containing protein [Methanobrevibacter thaueri]|uniref:DUF4268 domain-containing protein n=1 Tax=Methanobrevibacter thaueri TaxID=190975 RepID=UPI0026EFE1FE|nr:DUF4268 domain-containing protein [Methanobrevibacter thaueri]MBE6496513.1 DUF4268 domain-containing protein [Methanobrevibacter thaueri]
MNKDYFDIIENNVMSDLKDFQIATVERIDELYRQGQNRILVSDEVGLGKTLIARGTIAKFLKFKNENEDHILKVIYICSNATIANQNIEKLCIVQNVNVESADTSRLSMQHFNIFMQEYDDNILRGHIQLIPLTPKTSFVNNSPGTKDERALIYTILKRVPMFKNCLEELNYIFSNGVKDWNEYTDKWEMNVDSCNNKSNGKYLRYMIGEIYNYFDELQELQSLCKKVKINQKIKKRPIIRKFRLLFADISLNKLNPDLIIMDEFQRFRYLLENDVKSDMEMIISKFFKIDDDLRILMLSATPYKMYSTLDEIYEDEISSHYSEFLELMDFLITKKEHKVEFERIWENYSIELKEFNRNNFSFIEAKKIAEDKLYKNICRTERITETKLSDFIDDSDAKNSLTIIKEDVESFIEIQRLLDDIGLNINVPIDYVKSSPYLMSFMKNYKLKSEIESYFANNPSEVYKMRKDTFWINKDDINNYRKIPLNNSRLKKLYDIVMTENVEKLLWMPPSMPYYELQGPFKNKNNLSKTLIFSSWEMVPRMVSSLLSYEVERKTIGELKKSDDALNYSKGYYSDRLRFNLTEKEKPRLMSLFTFLYPSIFFCDLYNPVDCLNRKLSLNEIENEIKFNIKQALNEIPSNNSKNIDIRWYYLTPLILDTMYCGEGFVNQWFDDIDELIYKFYNEKGFSKYLDKLKTEYTYFNSFGKQPEDLLDVLCNMVLASPAICVYRLYEKEFGNGYHLISYYNKCSMRISREFINFMNRPQSTAIIDLLYKSNSEYVYWKNILKYSKNGNLQAVLDEYVHLLSSGLYDDDINKIKLITDKLLNSFNLTTSHYEFDTFEDFTLKNKDKDTMRTHFAVSFIKGKNDDSDAKRKKSVRDTFNSPFWPFVLTSTSIGQEGLDFHNYCRRIMHWNLPSNPIDLEQREGRINRYKCLAIRQNIARRYGRTDFKTNHIWDELFNKASESENSGSCSDLIPYWGLEDKDDMIKIERIVPMYPFSRDVSRYDRLIKILSLYRLTLGQSRQEYLINSLFRNYDFEKNELVDLFINLSPYYKSEIKDFKGKYNKIELNSGDEVVIQENNDLILESQKDNLPIKNLFFKLTTSDNSNFINFYNLSIDLSSYWFKLLDLNQNLNIFTELIKKDNSAYMAPIDEIPLNQIRFEMLIDNGSIKVMLFGENNEYDDSLFEFLFDQKNEIEQELGFDVFWNQKIKNKSWKILVYLPIDLNNENWDDSINWHLFIAKKFKETFTNRINEYFNQNPNIIRL